MAICMKCGAQVSDTSIFCGNCGASQNSPYKAPVSQAQEPPRRAYAEANYSQQAYRQQPYAQPAAPVRQASMHYDGDVPRPPKGSRYAVVGSWGYFWTLILLNVPVVGWIFTIVWACGGVHNYNLQRLARSFLIWWAITVVAVVLAVVVGGLSLGALTSFLSNM